MINKIPGVNPKGYSTDILTVESNHGISFKVKGEGGKYPTYLKELT